MLSYNPILDTDGYKLSHWQQYPPNMRGTHAYIESRGGRWPLILFFGPQIYMKRYLETRVTEEHLAEAIEMAAGYGMPVNIEGWREIIGRHEGRLPLSIRAVPEGTVLPTRNVLMTIEPTDPEFGWLPSFVETGLLRAAWYGSTVATNSFFAKRAIKPYLDETSDDPDLEIWTRLHDFGARAATSKEAAEIGGAAHLVNFTGTDTLDGVRAARAFYGAVNPGVSIPATEHSTITAWGKGGELQAYRHVFDTYGRPGAIFSCVSDTYDYWQAVNGFWGGVLREEVIASGAILVVRPDSGDPVETPIDTVVELAERFGTDVNSRGYRVLRHVRVIQGDGIGVDEIVAILAKLKVLGFSASNIAFGMGGKLLQADLNRDTLKMAQKLSAVQIGETWSGVSKAPIGAPDKASKKGRLALVRNGRSFETVALEGNEERNQLVEVFRNGEVTQAWDFSDVRGRATLAL